MQIEKLVRVSEQACKGSRNDTIQFTACFKTKQKINGFKIMESRVPQKVGLKQAREENSFFKPVGLWPIVTHAACYINGRQKMSSKLRTNEKL